MSSPSPNQFEEFYKAATLAIAELELTERLEREPGYKPEKAPRAKEPFPWQKRLTARVCDPEKGWPRAIALPTAAGKTACIDIAVFALACGAKDFRQPRRIFFVVDRRIVVDQAYEHAKKLAKVLSDAESGILKEVAESLRELTHEVDARPLDVYALRGGMYRESAWARSPLQPTIIASTVDQVGSRLLFRGYGVSDSMKPIHAGLVGNDSLILLDEAHCARPFDQTVQLIKNYRAWGEANVAPFHFVSITATPSEEVPDAQIERAAAEDFTHPILGARISASKPATLVIAEKASGKTWKQWGKPLVEKLIEEAKRLAAEYACVGIIVNRVATARELAKRLGDDAVLLTGRMRPLDRDRLFTERLQPLLSGAWGEPPKFVVGTQCLECGADFDFHALVTECASLDALRQRFGRLNRIAARPSAKAVIVVRADQTEPVKVEKTEDELKEWKAEPVYGNSLANTWQWLNTNANDGVFDFGVSAVHELTKHADLSALNARSQNAPMLFPAHLDSWVQTNPKPTPDPDPSLFLHGPKQPGQPDVQVVFRNDIRSDWSDIDIQRLWAKFRPDAIPKEKAKAIDEKALDLWLTAAAVCPPSSSEAVPVRISDFRRWLAGLPMGETSSDVEAESDEEVDEPPVGGRVALRWKGQTSKDTVLIADPKDDRIRPGDLFVVSCSTPGIDTLGDFLTTPPIDNAEEASRRSRDKATIRLPDLDLDADDDEFELKLTKAVSARIEAAFHSWPERARRHLLAPNLRVVDRHPTGGWVVTTKQRLGQFAPEFLDDEDSTESPVRRAITLDEHSRGVAGYAERFAKGCGLDTKLFTQAGLWHDLGKLDPRFQAMLRQSSPRTAVGAPLAKSAKSPRTNRERDEAREIHKYPAGARHELLSAALVAAKVGSDKVDDLLLHLIATHHGSARPFADAISDPAEDIDAKVAFLPKLFDEAFPLITYRQQTCEWNAELPERFWRVVRKLGWWGAAYHEAVFRLADHAQSAAEQERDATPPPFSTAHSRGRIEAPAEQDRDAMPSPIVTKWEALPVKSARTEQHALPLTGLDGANPLAFLAALGTLVVCDQLSRVPDPPAWLNGRVALSWGRHLSPTVPVLHLPGPPPAPADVAAFLAGRLAKSVEDHASAWVVDMLERGFRKGATRDFSDIKRHAVPPRPADRHRLDWVTALSCESAPDADSQLQTVRCDYLIGNLKSLLAGAAADHLRRALFDTWDYADGLSNQSLHWEPSEDRRHAYQWHQPNGDPTRKRRGGMLGANRLALEAWPLFPSFPDGSERVRTRGFRGNRAGSTFWLWPLWDSCLTPDGVASILSSPTLSSAASGADAFRGLGVTAVYRSQRILVGKTPNLTPAEAIA